MIRSVPLHSAPETGKTWSFDRKSSSGCGTSDAYVLRSYRQTILHRRIFVSKFLGSKGSGHPPLGFGLEIMSNTPGANKEPLTRRIHDNRQMIIVPRAIKMSSPSVRGSWTLVWDSTPLIWVRSGLFPSALKTALWSQGIAPQLEEKMQ